MLPGTALGFSGETLELPLRWRMVVCPTAPYVLSSSLRSSAVSDTALMARGYLLSVNTIGYTLRYHVRNRPGSIKETKLCNLAPPPERRSWPYTAEVNTARRVGIKQFRNINAEWMEMTTAWTPRSECR